MLFANQPLSRRHFCLQLLGCDASTSFAAPCSSSSSNVKPHKASADLYALSRTSSCKAVISGLMDQLVPTPQSQSSVTLQAL